MPIERIVQHKHCIQCGKAIPLDEKFCSEKCKMEYEALLKRKKMTLIINYLLMGFFIIILILMLGF